MEISLLQRDLQPTTESAAQFLQTANQPIETADAYQGGADFLKRIKTLAKSLDEQEKAITKPINESLKAIRDLFRKPKDLLDRAESALKSNLLAYQREEERKRMEAQRAADEEARKQRERLERQAAAAEAKGNLEQADAKREVAAAVVAPIIVSEKPKVAGISTRKDYTFEIVDATLLPRAFLMPDESKIRKAVKALGHDVNIPGVRVIEREILSAGSLSDARHLDSDGLK